MSTPVSREKWNQMQWRRSIQRFDVEPNRMLTSTYKYRYGFNVEMSTTHESVLKYKNEMRMNNYISLNFIYKILLEGAVQNYCTIH